MSWTNTAMVAPNSILRLGVTIALFLPLVIHFWLTPAIIILFVGLRFNSVAPFGYIPQGWLIYELLIIIIAIVHSLIYKKKNILKFSNTQIFILCFIFFIDSINLKIFSPLFLFFMALFILYNAIRDNVSLNITMLAFVFLTITLSLYYFLFAKEFMIVYSYATDTERAVWVDPNYFGLLLGCGMIISSVLLFSVKKSKINLFYKLIFIVCIILGFITIVLQASRGAILAVSSAILILIFFSKMKFVSKFILIILLILGIIYLFNSGLFSLLIERTLNDSTGSGRTEIWVNKLNHWGGSIVNIFGCGYQSSVYDFKPYKMDCHNEFVSIIINYGILGLIFTIIAFLKLLIIRNNRVIIWSFISFIGVGFMTLSPLTCQTGWTAIPFLSIILYKFIWFNGKLKLSK